MALSLLGGVTAILSVHGSLFSLRKPGARVLLEAADLWNVPTDLRQRNGVLATILHYDVRWVRVGDIASILMRRWRIERRAKFIRRPAAVRQFSSIPGSSKIIPD
jgi:hypothetical protein